MPSPSDISMSRHLYFRVNHLRLLATVYVLISLPAWAEVYRYRGPDGQLIFSNTPPPAGTTATQTLPEGAGPTVHTTVPTALQTPRVTDKKPKAKRKKNKKKPKRETPKAVSTHRFGRLKRGISQAEVKRLLGPPERRVRRGSQTRLVRLRGRYVSRKVRIETWHYPGSRRLLPTQLTFYNGLLAEKDKGVE